MYVKINISILEYVYIENNFLPVVISRCQTIIQFHKEKQITQ